MPLLAVHPFRVVRLRLLTSVVTALWAVAAALAVANPFPSTRWIQALLVLTAIYLASVGLPASSPESSGRRHDLLTMDRNIWLSYYL